MKKSELVIPKNPFRGENLVGKKFYRFTVISFAGKKIYPSGLKQVFWKCKCECGSEALVGAASIKRGKHKSCGCLQREVTLKNFTRHGYAPHGKPHALYSKWCGMKCRCYNKRSKSYSFYGGRGISVCESWNYDFMNFFNDMSPTWKKGMTLDRIDSNGNYEPSNCRWATRKEQSNNRRSNKVYTLNGKSMNMAQWGSYLGGSKSSIGYRLKAGWRLEDALSAPISKGNQFSKPMRLNQTNKNSPSAEQAI